MLKNLRKALSPTPTDGWSTVEALAKAEGISTTSARRLLNAGVEAGLVERKKFSVYSKLATGFRSTSHFREKK